MLLEFLLCGGVSAPYNLHDPFSAVVRPPFCVLLVLSLKLTDFSYFFTQPRLRRKFPRRPPLFAFSGKTSAFVMSTSVDPKWQICAINIGRFHGVVLWQMSLERTPMTSELYVIFHTYCRLIGQTSAKMTWASWSFLRNKKTGSVLINVTWGARSRNRCCGGKAVIIT